MASPHPIVLVHGAWHGAWCWDRLREILDQRGIPSVAVDLPGHGDSALPLGDLLGDAAHVTAALAAIDDDVVLVGHSYGGAVISQAAAQATNVVRLVYLTAFCLDVGESLSRSVVVEGLPAAPLNAAVVVTDGVLTLDPILAGPALYADCAPADADAAVARLDTQLVASFTQPTTAAAWRTLPSTYVLCTQDDAILPPLQAALAERCSEVVELAASHSPFLSVPTALADILEPLARA